jgi:hypothetical protein
VRASSSPVRDPAPATAGDVSEARSEGGQAQDSRIDDVIKMVEAAEEMFFEPTYFRYASVERTSAHYAQCQAELLACFARDWKDANREPALAVPAGTTAPSAVGVPRGLPRAWATTPPEMSKLGLRTHRLLRFEDAANHASTATLTERHLAFTRAVEFLLFDVARRLQPWGAIA